MEKVKSQLEYSKELEGNDYIEFTQRNSATGWAPVEWSKPELEKIINKTLSKYGLSLDTIREGRRIALDQIGQLWQEEHAALITGPLWQLLPIANRMDWIGEFLNRTHRQIQALLGIWFNWAIKNCSQEPYGLGDMQYEYYWDIEKHFIDFYKISYHFQYRDKPYVQKPIPEKIEIPPVLTHAQHKVYTAIKNGDFVIHVKISGEYNYKIWLFHKNRTVYKETIEKLHKKVKLETLNLRNATVYYAKEHGKSVIETINKTYPSA